MKSSFRRSLGTTSRALVTLGAAWLLASSASSQTIPSGGQSLISLQDVATQGGFYSTPASVATRTVVAVTGQPFTQAARINVLDPTGEFWSSAISSSSNRAVATDDVVLAHFFMRAVQTTDETGAVYCQVYAEKNSSPYSKSLSQIVSAGPAWVEYFIPFKMTESLASGDFGLKFGFGAAARPQILEIAGAELIWYGKSRTLEEMPRTSFQYDGRELDAPWRAEAAARIEQYRKGDYAIRVVNTAGLPVPGAQVRMKLRRHAFQFGCSWDAERIVDQSTSDNQTYRARLLELFNAGSTGNDLKWGPWIGDWGPSWSRTQTLNALAWMQANSGFHLRGHVLVWPSVRNTPQFLGPLIEASDPSVPQHILNHIADIVPATRDTIPEWDVLNEPFDNHDIMDKYGDAVMADWFKEARKHHATARLYINDYAIISGGGLNVAKQDAYAATIQYLLDQGAPLDGVGFQGHFDAGPTGMAKAWSIMQRYATEFPNLEFKITEFDVDTDEEELQADYLRDFLTLVFSHPKFTGFQVWGFWEGAHWKPRAAMVRNNWEEKPSATVWRSLVLDQCKTDQTRATGADGRVRGRAFLGDYDISVHVGGQTANATAVVDADGIGATITIDAAVDPAPRVTVQPIGTTVAPGESLQVLVEIAGAPAPAARWYKNGALISPSPVDVLQHEGVTYVPLAFPSAAASHEGTYFLELTNEHGTVRSRSFGIGVRAPEERTEKLVNISTRGKVLTGDAVMIAGFVIEGGPKDVLVRGVGPRLNALFGVPGVLANPALHLFRASDNGLVTSNADWNSDLAPVFAQVGAFPLVDNDPAVADDTLSAALRLTLDPGGYTVHMTGENGSTGVGLVETYDVALGEPLKLVNISTRGSVGTGDDILIAGFVVNGAVPQRVLIRGVGPQLGAFGVPGTLADPHITVLEPVSGGSRVVASNDDWCTGNDRDTIQSAASQVGAFGLAPYSRDSSLLLALEPGTYTVHLSSVGGSTGIAMVEVYAMP